MTVVVDADLLIAQVITLEYSPSARARLRSWLEDEVPLVAPTLWRYEAVSALRKCVVQGWILPDEARVALDLLSSLGIRQIEPDPDLEARALEWADRLDQTVAYDAAYLAVAERLDAELWTADRRLADAAHAAGAGWVHAVGQRKRTSS